MLGNTDDEGDFADGIYLVILSFENQVIVGGHRTQFAPYFPSLYVTQKIVAQVFSHS